MRQLVRQQSFPGLVSIVVFMAHNGKWSYCPALVRDWPAFNQADGSFDDAAHALEAIKADRTVPTGASVTVEGVL